MVAQQTSVQKYLTEHEEYFRAVVREAVTALETDPEYTILITDAASKINQRKNEREALSANLSA